MSCSFCRNTRHTKTVCNDPYIIEIAGILLTNIENKIRSSIRHSYSRSTFNTNMRIWLETKTIRELKIISEFLRRKGNEFRRIPPSNRGTTKHDIIYFILNCIIIVYGVTFRPTIPSPATENENPLLSSDFLNSVSTPIVPSLTINSTSHSRSQVPLNLMNIMDDMPTPTVVLSIERRPAQLRPTPSPQHSRRSYQPPPPARASIQIFKFEEGEKCNEEDCCICYNPMTDADFVQLNCNHQYCKSCIKRWMNVKTNTSCPMCRTNITTIKTRNPIVRYEL
jgi:hypothetical protein